MLSRGFSALGNSRAAAGTSFSSLQLGSPRLQQDPLPPAGFMGAALPLAPNLSFLLPFGSALGKAMSAVRTGPSPVCVSASALSFWGGIQDKHQSDLQYQLALSGVRLCLSGTFSLLQLADTAEGLQSGYQGRASKEPCVLMHKFKEYRPAWRQLWVF